MAICNLLTRLNKDGGTFYTFSQYTEDLTKNTVEGSNFRVIPSKFIAAYCNFDGWDSNSLPEYIQNYYENGVSICKSKPNWNSSISSNLFWNMLLRESFFNEECIKYIGDINFHSYNEYDGMGYSEIYCHIPEDGKLHQVTIDIANNDSVSYESNLNIEGYEDIKLDNPITYYPKFNFNLNITESDSEDQFQINTIIVFYNIVDSDGNIITLTEGKCEDLPMGIYFTGDINSDGTMDNIITKYISNPTAYGSGTSYGLRICSRYISTNTDNIKVVSTTEPDYYSDLSRVLEQISIVQNKMDDIVSQNYHYTQNYKELLSIFKNNQINVPYIKNINGVNYWFVNGKMVSKSTIDGEDQEYEQTLSLIANFNPHIIDITNFNSKTTINWKAVYGNSPIHVYELTYSADGKNEIIVQELNGTIEVEVPNPKKIMKQDYTLKAMTSYGQITGSAPLMYTYPSYFTCSNSSKDDTIYTLLQPSRSLDITYSNKQLEKIIYKYPQEYGPLVSIKDNLGLEYINDFEFEIVEENGINYYKYIDKQPAIVENYTLKFR